MLLLVIYVPGIIRGIFENAAGGKVLMHDKVGWNETYFVEERLNCTES